MTAIILAETKADADAVAMQAGLTRYLYPRLGGVVAATMSSLYLVDGWQRSNHVTLDAAETAMRYAEERGIKPMHVDRPGSLEDRLLAAAQAHRLLHFRRLATRSPFISPEALALAVAPAPRRTLRQRIAAWLKGGKR